MGISVGIDLGTTFSAIARINPDTGRPETIKNSFGSSITPSVLYFEQNGNILFGEDAKNMQGIGNTNTIAFFKRNMGNDEFNVELYGKQYSATDLSAILLSKLVEDIEKSSGEKIDSAVITVPAYFTHKERQATIAAGKRAGLNVLSIINEPTAAAFAYGLKENQVEQTVLIYDLGGGTFDVTVAKITKNNIDILGSDGNHELGGKDWDDCIARYLVQEFNEQCNIDLSESDEMGVALLVTAENVKKQLTSRDEVSIPLMYQNKKANIKITESLFEDISSFLLGTTKELTNNLIDSIGLAWTDISGTILVGGSTRMRMVRNYVKDMSGKEPLSGVNVDEAVVLGAAIKANIDNNEKNIQASNLKIGSDCRGNQIKIAGAKKVSDVTAHALGMIAVSENGESYINSIIIPRNSTIPAQSKREYNYYTSSKNNELEVYVIQGAYSRPLDNVIINKYVITKIERTVNNPSIIEISYRYTANGVVEVSAVQKETNKNLPIRIEEIPNDMSWTDDSPKNKNRNITVETEVMLAIDLSGSMSGEPIIKAQEAMEDFVNKMDKDTTNIGVVAFANCARLITSPTSNYKKVLKDIRKINVGDVGMGTMAEPFSIALKTMYSKFKKDDILKYIVVLTDGIWYEPKVAITGASRCHKKGIEIMALGFGEADEDFLKDIASTEDFASLTSLTELSGSFSKIAQAIGNKSMGTNML